MKTETRIAVIAYDLELIDLRTHEHLADRIVLEQSCLRELRKVDISDRDFIAMSCAQKGYLLHKLNTRRKISMSVDLGQLYAKVESRSEPATEADMKEVDHG